MSRKRWQTAEELMAELQADPEFMKREAESKRKWSETDRMLGLLEQPIVDDLREVGCIGGSLSEIVSQCAPLSPEVVRVLLGWLPRIQDDRIKESLIRALGAAREPYDGRPLVECFQQDTCGILQWAVANTIALSRPFGITDWVVEAIKTPTFGGAREMLVLAAAEMLPGPSAISLLMSLLDEFPSQVANCLGDLGGADELDALQNRLGIAKMSHKAEFLRAIQKIKKRLHSQA